MTEQEQQGDQARRGGPYPTPPATHCPKCHATLPPPTRDSGDSLTWYDLHCGNCSTTVADWFVGDPAWRMLYGVDVQPRLPADDVEGLLYALWPELVQQERAGTMGYWDLPPGADPYDVDWEAL